MLGKSTGASTFGFGFGAAIEEGPGVDGWYVCSEGDDPPGTVKFEDFEPASSCRSRFITSSDTPPPAISFSILVAGSSVILGTEGRTEGRVGGAEGEG